MKENVSGCFFLNTVYVYMPVDTLYKHNGMAILALFVSILYQRVTNRRTDVRAIGAGRDQKVCKTMWTRVPKAPGGGSAPPRIFLEPTMLMLQCCVYCPSVCRL